MKTHDLKDYKHIKVVYKDRNEEHFMVCTSIGYDNGRISFDGYWLPYEGWTMKEELPFDTTCRVITIPASEIMFVTRID